MIDGYALKNLAIKVTETEPFSSEELFKYENDIYAHFRDKLIFKPLVSTIELFKKYDIRRFTTQEYGITHAIDCLNITYHAGGLIDSCIMALTHDNLEETFEHYLKESSQLSMQIAYLRSMNRKSTFEHTNNKLDNIISNVSIKRKEEIRKKIDEIQEVEKYLFFDDNNPMIKEYENMFSNKPKFYSDQLKLLSYRSHISPDILITPFDKKYNYKLYKQYVDGITQQVLIYQNNGNDNTCSLHAKIADRIHNSKTLLGLETKQINNALEKDIILIDSMTERIMEGLIVDNTSKKLLEELHNVISTEMRKDYREDELYKRRYKELNCNAEIGLKKIDQLFKMT